MTAKKYKRVGKKLNRWQKIKDFLLKIPLILQAAFICLAGN
jgi:hypothetical protein